MKTTEITYESNLNSFNASIVQFSHLHWFVTLLGNVLGLYFHGPTTMGQFIVLFTGIDLSTGPRIRELPAGGPVNSGVMNDAGI
jgi:hypothetical protein